MTNVKSAPDQRGEAVIDFRTAKFISSWREEALARVSELNALIDSWRSGGELSVNATELLAGAKTELTYASQTTQRQKLRDGRLTGAVVQRVHGHLDAAEMLVLRAAPLEYVQGQTPALVAYVRSHLVPSDPRCQAAEQVLEAEGIGARAIGVAAAGVMAPDAAPAQMSEANRDRLVAAVHGAMAEARNEQMRVRSFRNLLLIFTGVLTALAIGVCVLGLLAPEKLPVCFQPVQTASNQSEPRRLVCPLNESGLSVGEDIDTVVVDTVNHWDVPLIELLGLIAAAVAAATAFRKVSGTNTPYSLPATLALLKLPLGALTALLGLLLMRGNFVPGLTALDSSAQIIGWAVVFGYAQQAFTQVVDRKTQALLTDVGGAEQREKSTAATPRRP